MEKKSRSLIYALKNCVTSAPVTTKLATARDLPYGISGKSDEKCGKYGQNITCALRNITDSIFMKLILDETVLCTDPNEISWKPDKRFSR
jgi:hypothetical protein